MKITIFSVPKAFTGHIGIVQKNAIRSWLNIEPQPEIFLFGDDHGVVEASEDLGVKNVPAVCRNRHGTPYIDIVFSLAQALASSRILCYINADNLLFQNFQDAVSRVIACQLKPSETGSNGWITTPLKDFLIVGERFDVNITEQVDTKDPDILDFVMKSHKRQPFPGLDYFVFPKGMVRNMPPFVVGRAGWDNWLIYDARRRGIPVIDATGQITVAHQNHDYAHITDVPGGSWHGSVESKENLALVKNRYIYLWELADSNCVLTEEGIREKPYTYRKSAQDIILGTPVGLHGIVEPIFRAGHVAKYGYLKLVEKIR